MHTFEKVCTNLPPDDAQSCFCGARPASQHFVGKRAMIHILVWEIVGREGMVDAEENRYSEIFDRKTAAPTFFCGARSASLPLT
jgi:hypothetical protein